MPASRPLRAPAPAALRGERAPPTPAAVARWLRRQGIPGVALLESGLKIEGAPGPLGRFSFVAARPTAVAAAEPGRGLRRVDGAATPGERPAARGCPLEAARAFLDARRPARGSAAATADGAPFPFAGGAVLTLSYDLGRRFERLPEEARAEARAPDLHLAVYERVLAFDHATGEVRLLGRGRGGVGLTAREVREALAAAAAEPEPGPGSGGPAPGGSRAAASSPAMSLDRAAYRQAVREVLRLIRRGDLFEVNVSRRYEAPGVDPERVYEALRALAPAPYMADLDLGDGRRLLSASPERFLSLSAAGRITSWPIKGTRPRGATPREDAKLRAELLGCEKEAAELAMIVDLVRNDLGRVAAPGSVRVAAPRALQSWPTVHHTVAAVEADLEPGRTWSDLVRAAFPPGSVTGAPKIRAMEVIERLEPVRRGLYCGAFGWVGWDGALELAVAIRIVACEGARAFAHAGGAVLLGSDPAAEEREAAAKARALLAALARGARSPSGRP